ncbi:Alg9-like mannosyltransferase family-domain-containing protein [Myxozyma melibiosi]|uniref:Mannosyltransferase n=1 Tax=Myxozyma melibiosi TaxID=54550 RepID=A0ABR1F4L4_9ASCO
MSKTSGSSKADLVADQSLSRHLLFVFAVVAGIRSLCARFSIIPDCDEVFNYWEPTHYLTHGFGLETWEYSPVYAIRSWSYAWIHAVLVNLCRLIGFSEAGLFFALRAVLGTFCAFCEVQLYGSLLRNVSQSAAQWFIFFSLTATGMFHASVTYLPSSFSMYFTMLAYSKILEPESLHSPGPAILMFSVSAVLGWPFSVAVAIPFFSEILRELVSDPARWKIALRIVKAGLLALTLLAGVVAFDSYAFQKLQIVPLNIVLYNVLGTDETGPEIFGTEKWTYYVFNLLLNFNVVVLFAILSAAVMVNMTFLYSSLSTTKIITILSPLFLWSIIFFRQPHKEERFFYVVYPLICMNAAIFVDSFIVLGKRLFEIIEVPASTIRALDYIVHIEVVALVTLIAFSRIAALHSFYFAPLEVYGALFDENAKLGSQDSDILNVCVGREWYRYPSSYFLPENMRLKFIQSDFDGMLPTEFVGESWLDGASRVPAGLNNVNKQELSFYVPVSECDYLVDSNFTVSDVEGTHEQQYVADTEWWQVVNCSRLLDNDQSSLLARIFKLPEAAEGMILETPLYHRTWVSYCLLKSVKR